MLIVEETKPIKISANAGLVLPHSPLILPPRDDTAEYDDTGDTYNLQDDPKYVSAVPLSLRIILTIAPLCI